MLICNIFPSDSGLSFLSGHGGGYASTGAAGVSSFGSDTVDDCGLRFLLLIRHHTALIKSVPPWQRTALQEKVRHCYFWNCLYFGTEDLFEYTIGEISTYVVCTTQVLLSNEGHHNLQTFSQLTALSSCKLS